MILGSLSRTREGGGRVQGVNIEENLENKVVVVLAIRYYHTYTSMIFLNYGYYLKMQRIFSSRFSSLLGKNKYGFAEMDKFKQSFLSTTNLPYIESLYENWLQDKNSVSPSFAAYFELIEKGRDPYEAFEAPGQVAPKV